MERPLDDASACAASAASAASALARQAPLARLELPDAAVRQPSGQPGGLFSLASPDAASSPEISSVVPCEPPLSALQDQRARRQLEILRRLRGSG